MTFVGAVTDTAAGECLSLASVLYRASDSGSYSLSDQSNETWTGVGTQSASGQQTTTSGANAGGTRQADDSTFSYTLTAASA